MDEVVAFTLKNRLDEANYKKLLNVNSPTLHKFVAKYVEHCNPDTVFVNDDSEESVEYVRKTAIEAGEEGGLAMDGHTYHFDNSGDQGRESLAPRITRARSFTVGE